MAETRLRKRDRLKPVKPPPALGHRHPATIIATWFWSGLLPGMPGTWGAAAALPFGWGLMALGGPALIIAAAIAVFVIGTWAAHRYALAEGRQDPGEIVVDEVVAQWLVLAVIPLSLPHYAAAFLLFRFFDIAKVWPVGLIDRRVKGGIGVMLDDLVAAVYAGAILIAAGFFLGA